jgi:hypothetical protein
VRHAKLDGSLWVTGTNYIVFSIGFALQSFDYNSVRLRRVRKRCIPTAVSIKFDPYAIIGG